MRNIYRTFINTDKYTQVQRVTILTLVSFRWEGVKEMRPRGRPYTSIDTYIQHITLTWHLQYNIIIKDLSWRKNIIFCGNACCFLYFFATGVYCDIVSFSICPFYSYKRYCAAGWMVTWNVGFMPLVHSPGSAPVERREIKKIFIGDKVHIGRVRASGILWFPTERLLPELYRAHQD